LIAIEQLNLKDILRALQAEPSQKNIYDMLSKATHLKKYLKSGSGRAFSKRRLRDHFEVWFIIVLTFLKYGS